MLQAAAAFGAGLVAHGSLRAGCAQLPACSTSKCSVSPADGGTAFKLSISVHTACVLSVGHTGALVRVKPRVVAAFGGREKETEVAEQSPKKSMSPFKDHRATTARDGGCRGRGTASGGSGYPGFDDEGSSTWRFGETLTFSGRSCDLRLGGLRLRLCAQSDVCLGPLQMELAEAQELGEAVVDVRRHVLPVCVPTWGECGPDDAIPDECPLLWETPVLVVPLTRISQNPHRGAEVNVAARLVLSFGVSVDPETVLREIREAERPLVERLEGSVGRLMSCIASPANALACGNADDSWNCTMQRLNKKKIPRPRPTLSPLMNDLDEPESESSLQPAAPRVVDWAFRL